MRPICLFYFLQFIYKLYNINTGCKEECDRDKSQEMTEDMIFSNSDSMAETI